MDNFTEFLEEITSMAANTSSLHDHLMFHSSSTTYFISADFDTRARLAFGRQLHLHPRLRHGQLHVRKIPLPCPAIQAGEYQIVLLHIPVT